MTTRSPSSGTSRHAIVVAYLALFAALGGSAVAASERAADDIAPQTIRNADVRKNTFKSNRLRDGKAVAGQDVIPDSLTGAAIDEETLELGPPGGAAGGSLTGEYPNPLLGPNTVGAGELQDNAVTTPKLADNSVNSAKVAANTLTGGDLADGSVASDDVTDESIRSADIGPNAVGTAELKNSAVGSTALDAIDSLGNVTNLAAGAAGNAAVSCPAGSQMIGGGAAFDFDTGDLTRSMPNGNGWLARGQNAGTSQQNLYVQVLCLRAGAP